MRCFLTVLASALCAGLHITSSGAEDDRGKAISRAMEVIDKFRARTPMDLEGLEVARAIAFLGDLKAVEAAKALVEKLDFRDPTATEPSQYYPALLALVEIGQPALPALLDAISTKNRTPFFLNNARILLNAWLPRRMVLAHIDQNITNRQDDLKRLESFRQYCEKEGAKLIFVDESVGKEETQGTSKKP